jgi:hypothetical protein
VTDTRPRYAPIHEIPIRRSFRSPQQRLTGPLCLVGSRGERGSGWLHRRWKRAEASCAIVSPGGGYEN